MWLWGLKPLKPKILATQRSWQNRRGEKRRAVGEKPVPAIAGSDWDARVPSLEKIRRAVAVQNVALAGFCGSVGRNPANPVLEL